VQKNDSLGAYDDLDEMSSDFVKQMRIKQHNLLQA
jgi:hypothetical protein